MSKVPPYKQKVTSYIYTAVQNPSRPPQSSRKKTNAKKTNNGTVKNNRSPK